MEHIRTEWPNGRIDRMLQVHQVIVGDRTRSRGRMAQRCTDRGRVLTIPLNALVPLRCARQVS